MTSKSLPQSMTELLSWRDLGRICKTHEGFFDAHHWLIPLTTGSADWPEVMTLNQISARLIPEFQWTFVTSPKLPRRSKSKGMTSLSGYVATICRQKQIPVRERNLHDFLNAASFMIFPRSKLALNERHLVESPDGLKPGQNRTRTQDLLTMFDEGGVLRLKSTNQFRDLIFGHAVYEHLVLHKKIRAARLDIPVDDNFFNNSIETLTAYADTWFARWLQDPSHCLKSDEFSHVWIPQT